VAQAIATPSRLGPLALCAIGVLLLWVAVEVLSGFFVVTHGSEFGLSLGANGRVIAVKPVSAAAAAGIRAGDRIALERMTPGDRDAIAYFKAPGTQIVAQVEQGGRTRLVPLQSLSVNALPNDWIDVIGSAVVAIVLVWIGAMLVVLRPTRVTWAFFGFACGYSIVQLGYLQNPGLLRQPWFEVHAVLAALALLMTLWGGAVFSARFPDGSTNRWSIIYERAVFLISPFVAVLYVFVAQTFDSRRLFWVRTYDVALLGLMLAAIVLIVYRSHFDGDAASRARGRWVNVGLAVGIGALAVDFAVNLLGIAGSFPFPPDLLGLGVVVIPISVAYAVLRHHVIDVRFAVNRALVYGSITTLFLLALSAIEWAIGKKLADHRVAAYIEIGVALAIGLWFNVLHRRIERFFDRVFFWQQHRAELHLTRVAAAIPHAASVEAVDRLLVDEPLRAYRLTSAAVFRRREDGSFARVASAAWAADALECIPPTDPMPAYLAAERAPLDLDDLAWAPAQPAGPGRPILAVPIAARSRLIAFTLYGATEAGETLDPDQRRTLQHLATAAAAAYDHLEAEALRRETAELRVKLADLTPEVSL
jgi:hypothetical protein